MPPAAPAGSSRGAASRTLDVFRDAGGGSRSESWIAALRGRRVTIVGYGNQGRPHALNLRESGVAVAIAGRDGSASLRRAASEGFATCAVAEGASAGDLVVVAVPDAEHGPLCMEQLIPRMRAGAVLGFIHGYSIRFGLVAAPPSVGVAMVAPKGPGPALRRRYLEGTGVPCLFAVHQPGALGLAEPLALAWAAALGCGRAGMIRTSFAEEAESDLFGEQAILCGGAMELAKAAFATLVEAGYPSELAYIECVHELKQVVDLLFERGFEGMYAAISETAEFGAHRAGPRIVDAGVRARMRELLDEIRGGGFADAMASDRRAGGRWLAAERRRAAEDPIDRAGAVVRSWMPWLGSPSAESVSAACPEDRR
ncbi:MAG TPA: ketol-acid reductoisomerase [Phycisphaerales bacterium]|nr:ketol-acid reductoisomerase [Phycisphaerales bacterium]HMP35937.1 ketol-acid reductoisomerase [Phycisphaerales bacterium]